MEDLAVLIPVYNDHAELLETLDSIREQDNSFTVFVVDDGSEPPVEVEAAAYPFAVRVLRQPRNGGIVEALNAGIAKIREENFRFMARLDAADLNRPGRFRRQYDHLVANPGLVLVGSNVVYRDEESGEPLFVTNLPQSPESARRWIVFRNCFIHPAVMLRTEVFDETGIYEGTYPHIEDYVLFSRIVKHHRAANLAIPLVDCMIRAQGISRRNERRQLLSGLRFRLSEPRPFDPLWHAFIAKRVSYLVLPLRIRHRMKKALGFTRAPGGTRRHPSSETL